MHKVCTVISAAHLTTPLISIFTQLKAFLTFLKFVRRTHSLFAVMVHNHCGLVCMFTIEWAVNGKANRWLLACLVLHLFTSATHPLCPLIFYSCSTTVLNSSGEAERGKPSSVAVMKLRVNHQSKPTLFSLTHSCRTTQRKSFHLDPDPIKVVPIAGETINAHYKPVAWAAEDFSGLAGEKKHTSDSDSNWRRQLFPPDQGMWVFTVLIVGLVVKEGLHSNCGL